MNFQLPLLLFYFNLAILNSPYDHTGVISLSWSQKRTITLVWLEYSVRHVINYGVLIMPFLS